MKKLHDKTQKQIHYNISEACNLRGKDCFNPLKRKIQWNLSKSCNMRCSYCFNTLEEKTSPPINLDLEIIKKSFMRLDPSIIVITGGEPFLIKNFVEVCEIITKKHELIILTNLSHDVDPLQFCLRINPEKILEISISLHFLFREGTYEFGEFCYNIELLKKHKFPYRLSQIMTPEIIDGFPIIQNSINSKIYPKTLEGIYNGKKYPTAYTEDERITLLEIIKQVNGEEPDVYMAKKILEGYSDKNEITFTGKLCSSGYDDIVIVEDGTIYQCWNQLVPLGNFFEDGLLWWDEPQQCHYDWCACPQMGFEDTEKYIYGDRSLIG